MVFNTDQSKQKCSLDFNSEANWEDMFASEDIVLEVNPDDFLNLPSNDLFKEITSDLGNFVSEDKMKDMLLASDSYINEFNNNGNLNTTAEIKCEPPSPLICSYLEQTDHSTIVWPSLIENNDANTPPLVLENNGPYTPPITPPNSSPSLSPPTSPSSSSSSNGEDMMISFTQNNFNIEGPITAAASTVITTANTPLKPQPIPSQNITSSANLLQSTLFNTHIKSEVPSNGQQPLVLTPDEFLQLTEQGFLRFTSPTVISNQNQNSLTLSNNIINSLNATPTGPNGTLPITTLPLVNSPQQGTKSGGMDMKNLKRQQRMIKNRESACLSRKKKKEYLQTLEMQINSMSNENLLLRLENERLKERVQELEKENLFHKIPHLSSTTKKVTLLALFCFLTINISPFSGVFLSNEQNLKGVKRDTATVHSGRTLLWSGIEEESPENLILDVDIGQPPEDILESTVLNSSFDLKPACPMYINKTESQRLERDLRGWVFGSDHQKKRPEQKNKVKSAPTKVVPFPHRLRSFHDKNDLLQDKQGSWFGTKELQIYEPHLKMYDDFLEAINRRDDTFYMVSFKSDQLLLPAVFHNKTRRPRMSLILPAITLNDTVKAPKNHIAMMQIDCDVMNTKLVYIKESLIPVSASSNPSGPTPYFKPTAAELKHNKSNKNTSKNNNSNNSNGNMTFSAYEKLNGTET